MGNIDARRDWGHSKDYVRAMHLILKHTKPDDFVIATGNTRSIRQLCKVVFENLNEKLQIEGDLDQLQQVISNLIENALKYGGTEKEIKIKVLNF